MEFERLPRGLPDQSAASGEAPRAVWMPREALAAAPEKWAFSKGKIFLGALPLQGDRFMLGLEDNRHIMTVAGSRAGKGVSAIVPNLLTYDGSVLVVDPKGENATLTCERRGQGRGIEAGGMEQDVYVIDPFGTAKVGDEYRAGFNPFADLDPHDENFVDECDAIADALIVAPPDKTNDHWNSSARMVLRGFITWVAAAPDIATRDMTTLRDLLYLPAVADEGKQGFDDQLKTMLDQPNIAAGVPAETASALMGMGEDEQGSVLSTVRGNIGFLSSPPMEACLASSLRSPDLKKWKQGGVSVYLCLPAGRLHRHSRFFRLFLNRLLSAIEDDQEPPRTPAIMILDEMHVLGHMAALETAAGLIAGFGVRLWSIWQDMSQLKDLYPRRWETFMGNAGLLQFFGLNDMTTLEYVSKRLGTSSVMSISEGEISVEQSARGFSGQSKSIQSAPLLTPSEINYHFSRQSDNQLLFYHGINPIYAKRVWYKDPFFDKVRPHD